MYSSKRAGKGTYTLSKEPLDDGGDEIWMDDEEAESLGLPEVDAQHTTLIALANRLYHAIQDTHDYDLQTTLLDELVSFTQYHFSSEEALMDRYGDPGAESHKRQHAHLIAQVQFFRYALSHSDGQMILSALRPWLIRHIKTCDRALATFLSNAMGGEADR
jgi:hemerythrin-like metal-binding protein